MSTVKKQVEITVRLDNEPTAMGRLMAAVATCGAEVLAASSYCSYDGAVVMLITDDEPRTSLALTAAGFDCRQDSVLLVQIPEKPGLAPLLGAKLIAAGIQVLYSYSFRSDNQGYVVFKTTDDSRAFYLLEVEALVHELAAAKSWRGTEIIPFEEEEVQVQAA